MEKESKKREKEGVKRRKAEGEEVKRKKAEEEEVNEKKEVEVLSNKQSIPLADKCKGCKGVWSDERTFAECTFNGCPGHSLCIKCKEKERFWKGSWLREPYRWLCGTKCMNNYQKQVKIDADEMDEEDKIDKEAIELTEPVEPEKPATTVVKKVVKVVEIRKDAKREESE